MDAFFNFYSLDRINRILRIFVVLSKFPDEILKTQSASSGDNLICKYQFAVEEQPWFRIYRANKNSLFRRRRLGILCFFRKQRITKNPTNPVNPVYISLIRIASMPHNSARTLRASSAPSKVLSRFSAFFSSSRALSLSPFL